MSLRSFQTNFTSGELDPRLHGRRTIKHWFNGARYIRNALLRPQGGVHRRPGGEYKDQLLNQVRRIVNGAVDGTAIDFSEGTATGSDWDDDSLLIDGSFDHETSTSHSAASVTSINFDVDWGASNDKNVTGIEIHESRFVHFLGSGTDRAVTVTLFGSATGAFAGEETTLGTKSITMKAGSSVGSADFYELGADNSGPFLRYHRVSFSWTTAATVFLSEIVFFEGGTVTTMTITTPNGGTGANLVDDDFSTEVVTTTNMSTTDPYVVAQIEFNSARSIAFVDVHGLRLSAAPVGADGMASNFFVQHSTDGVAWTSLGEPIPIVTTSDITRRRSSMTGLSVTANFLRLVKVGDQDGGTAKVHVDELCPFEELTTVSNTKIIPFLKATAQSFTLVLTDLNARVFKDGAFVADVLSPIPHADILAADYVQNLDTALLFHETYQPQKIFRENGDDDWSSVAQVFSNIPQFDFGDGAENTWSDARGWPRCGTFFQSRLWMASSTERPDTVWASKSDEIFDFNIGTGLDDEAIERTIVSEGLVQFHQLYPGRHLYAFGEGAEFYSENSEDTILTPTNFALRRTTKSGSKIGVQPYEVDGAVLFVQRGGAVIREFIFTDAEAAYLASNVSLLSSHLVRNPVDTSLRLATSNDDADIYFAVNSDGTLGSFTTLRTQEISAWSLQQTAGSYKSCGVELDDVYFVVERSIDGVTKNFLERWEDDQLMDASIRGTVSSPTSTISGLDHLNGEMAEAVIDDVNVGQFLVSGGSITLNYDCENTYQVGLPFPDVTTDSDIADDTSIELTDKQVLIVELPVEFAVREGSVSAKKKKIADSAILLHQTRHIQINGDDINFRIDGTDLDVALPLFTGMFREGAILGWTLEGAIQLSQDRASEMEVLGITKDIAV